MMKDSTLKIYKERILRVLLFMQQSLDDDPGLETLARVAHFSPYHFHRIFRGMVGESVKEYIRRLRLERAAFHLKTTQRSVTRIAFEAGYETHESFTRAFRDMFRESPSAFRKKSGASSIILKAPSGVHFSTGGELHDFKNREEYAKMNAEIKKLEPMKVAFMRHVGPYAECGKTWGKLCAWAGPKGLFGPQTLILGLSYDDPEVTPPEKIRYDACIVVGDDIKPEGDVGVQTIGGGEYAVTIHKGPYEKLSETYSKLMGDWLPRKGREAAMGPCIEIYKNNPESAPPEELLTEVCVPLE